MAPRWNKPGECTRPGCPNNLPWDGTYRGINVGPGEINLVHNGNDLCFHGNQANLDELQNGGSGGADETSDHALDTTGAMLHQEYQQGRHEASNEGHLREEARAARQEARAKGREARARGREARGIARARAAREEAAELHREARYGNSDNYQHFQVSGGGTTAHISSSSTQGVNTVNVHSNQVASHGRRPRASRNPPAPLSEHSPPPPTRARGFRERFKDWNPFIARKRNSNELAKVVVERRKRNPY